MRFAVALTVLSIFVGVSATLHASTINFTATTVVSGDIYLGDSFSDATMTIQGSYDTSAIFGSSFVAFPVTYTIDGFGSFTDTYGAGGATGVLGVYSDGTIFFDGSFLFTQADGLIGYDLLSPIGPVTGAGSDTYHYTPTSGGDLEIDSFSDVTYTFSSKAATPEPSSLLLLSTGLAGTIGFARRRFSRS